MPSVMPWGAVWRRLPAVFCVLAILLAARPLHAQDDDDDDEAPEPAAAAPRRGPPSESVVRLEKTLSLRDLVQRLEDKLPRRIGSPDDFTAYNDTLEVRYSIERDSLRLELDGYDFSLTYHSRYWLYTRARKGPGF